MANFIAVITFLGTCIIAISKIFGIVKVSKSYNKYFSISDYVAKVIGEDSLIHDEIARNSKIAVVDDVPDDIPIEYLRRVGFSIDVFEKVSLADASNLGSYDLVLLDIVGVVEEDMEKGGLELLKKLKAEHNPPVIVAISARKFDPTVTDFFKLADDVLRKPINASECEEHVRRLLKQHISPCIAAKSIDVVLSESHLTPKQHAHIRKLILRYLSSIISLDSLRHLLMKKYALSTTAEIAGSAERIRKWVN